MAWERTATSRFVTVELDDEVQQTALSAPWPPWVRFESGDGAEAVGGLGQFDLIFPDAPGGKIFKLGRTVAALRRGGVLVVDDMDLTRHEMINFGPGHCASSSSR
jgi:predicted O-methyltransferase YrrM